VNERTGEEVAYEDIVKGYDLGGDEYVILSPDEIASVAPGRSHTIDIVAFVDLAEIDPVYFDRPYYVAPAGKKVGKGAEHAYALLTEAMRRADKVAIASFVMRDKQYLVAVRPGRDSLVLETLHYADEVRDPVQEIDTLPVETEFQSKELDMAAMLIETMTEAWRPEEYRDVYRERLESLIEQKSAGGVVTVEGPEPQAAPVTDLLAALEASIGAKGASRSTGGGRASASRAVGRTPGRHAGKRAARQPAAANRGRTGEDLGSMTKTALLQRAADLEIPGRSKMDRDELEQAVRAATDEGRRAAS
jgi:DNA end-binding protein Ku